MLTSPHPPADQAFLGLEQLRASCTRPGTPAATFMIASGADIRVVQALLGHSRITVTEGYADVAHEIKRQAVDRVASASMEGQLTGSSAGSGGARAATSDLVSMERPARSASDG